MRTKIAVIFFLLCLDLNASEILRLDVSIVRQDGEAKIKFVLSASEDIDIKLAELPWQFPEKFVFFGVTEWTQKPIERARISGSTPAVDVHLRKGEEIIEYRSVATQFPDFEEKIKIGDLIFFWQWSPRLLKITGASDFSEDYGGWFIARESSLMPTPENKTDREKRRQP